MPVCCFNLVSLLLFLCLYNWLTYICLLVSIVKLPHPPVLLKNIFRYLMPSLSAPNAFMYRSSDQWAFLFSLWFFTDVLVASLSYLSLSVWFLHSSTLLMNTFLMSLFFLIPPLMQFCPGPGINMLSVSPSYFFTVFVAALSYLSLFTNLPHPSVFLMNVFPIASFILILSLMLSCPGPVIIGLSCSLLFSHPLTSQPICQQP